MFGIDTHEETSRQILVTHMSRSLACHEERIQINEITLFLLIHTKITSILKMSR
jgi:hypothetical protein